AAERAREGPGRADGGPEPSLRLVALAAAHVAVALDLAADQGAQHAADDGAGGALAARVDAAADQGADAGADDEAGGAVAAAAIIPPVGAPIDFILGAERPFLVARVLAI